MENAVVVDYLALLRPAARPKLAGNSLFELRASDNDPETRRARRRARRGRSTERGSRSYARGRQVRESVEAHR